MLDPHPTTRSPRRLPLTPCRFPPIPKRPRHHSSIPSLPPGLIRQGQRNHMIIMIHGRRVVTEMPSRAGRIRIPIRRCLKMLQLKVAEPRSLGVAPSDSPSFLGLYHPLRVFVSSCEISLPKSAVSLGRQLHTSKRWPKN